jgi:NADPH2:quinone reductase
MKEAIVAAGPKVTIKESPMPEPGPDEVVIKVIVSGSNPKDWYFTSPSHKSFYHQA